MLYANDIQSNDAYWNGYQHYASYWEVMLGRWGLFLVSILHGGLASPTISMICAILLFSVAGVLLASIFGIKGWVSRSIVGAVICTSPFVSATLTYAYTADSYALSFLLAVLAVFFLQNSMGLGWPKYVLAVVCATFSFSVYQANFGVFLAAGIGCLLLALLGGQYEFSKVWRYILNFVVVAVVTAILYYAITQLVLAVMDLPLSDYRGMSSFTITSIFSTLGTGIASAYEIFAGYFTRNSFINNLYRMNYWYMALGVILVISLAVHLWKIRKQKWIVLLVLVLIGIFPMASNVIAVILPQAGFYLMMAGGMIVAVPLAFAVILQHTEQVASKPVFNRYYVTKSIAAALVLLMIWSNALTNSTDALVMLSEKTTVTMLANRIWAEVEKHPSYEVNKTRVLIAGKPNEGNYRNPSELLDKANQYAKDGIIHGNFEGSLPTWSEVNKRFAGVRDRGCTIEQFKEIAATDEFQSMPLYPNEGSVRMIGEILVVKVSSLERWK